MTARRLFYVACALVVLFATYGILHADDGIVRTSANVDGIPVEIFAPSLSPNERPASVDSAVVVAHGYAGSKQLVYAFARTLSRENASVAGGNIVLVFDFSGHGANTSPLLVDRRADQLQVDLDRVVQYARTLPRVDPAQVALIGHSMGASAIVQYAKQHRDIGAAIAISGNALDITPETPKNLLLMAGELEFDSIRNAQSVALANAGGASENFGAGRARLAHVVPGVEHITILWSSETLNMVSYWLAQSFHEHGVVWSYLAPDDTMGWVISLTVAAFALFFPLSSFAVSRLGLRMTAPSPSGLPYWQVLLVAAVPAVLAPLILRGLSLTPLDPATWLPIQIVNYLAMHFLLYAALMLGMLRLLGVRDLWARIRSSARPVALLLAALFLAWIYVTNGVVAHLTWMNFLPSGTRLWLWPVVGLLALPYFVLNEYVTKAATVRQSALNELASKLALIGSLLFAVAITPGLFFLLLVIAVFAVFFAVYGAYAVHLHHLTGNPLIAALGYAAMTAALLVAVFPITA